MTLLIAMMVFAGAPCVYSGEKAPAYGVGQGYGEKRPVNTAEEATEALKDYVSGKDLKIGTVVEKEFYFEADITDHDGKLVDKVIIDRRTGRIRSIY